MNPPAGSAWDPADLYGEAFFSEIEDSCVGSARVVVPLVVRWLSPRRVLDVGCGEGAWAEQFRAAGCSVLGLDGTFVDRSRLRIPTEDFVAHDLRESLPREVASFGADLVVCLEVVEHLPAERGPGLVRELCLCADRVLFSAAVPGQGGHGHVNERPHEYWVRLFEDCGFAMSAVLQRRLAHVPGVAWWYRQNLFAGTRVAPAPRGGRLTACVDRRRQVRAGDSGGSRSHSPPGGGRC